MAYSDVATKYLPNYLHWFKWLQTLIDEKEIVKARQLLVNSSTKITNVELGDYKFRSAIYI